MLSHPAVLLGDAGSDTQSKALLAEQSVTTVTGTVGDNLAGLGEVADVLLLVVAGPGHVFLTGLKGSTHGVEAGNEVAVAVALGIATAVHFVLEALEHLLTHDGHDAHVGHHVGGVGDFDTDLGQGGIQRAHAEGNHVHGTALHGTIEVGVEDGAHLSRGLPVVGRTSVFLLFGADECAFLYAGHVRRSRTSQEAAGALLGVQANVGAFLHEHVAELGVLFLGTVAPVDGIGFAELANLFDPLSSLLMSSTCNHGDCKIPHPQQTCNTNFREFGQKIHHSGFPHTILATSKAGNAGIALPALPVSPEERSLRRSNNRGKKPVFQDIRPACHWIRKKTLSSQPSQRTCPR